MVKAITPHQAYVRGAPPNLPFHFDLETVKRGLNFTLTTNLGWIDLLGEVVGGGKYEDLVGESSDMVLHGTPWRVLNLEMLIRIKRAAGRPKDFEAIAELELLRDRAPKKILT